MPSGWSGDCVFMLRMTASLSAIWAIFGKYSQTCSPVTFDGIGRKGPPVGRPGFMSKVSIWLAPPFIHKRMHRFLDFLAASAALRAWASPPQFGTTSPDPITAAPLRNARRDKWESMVDLND